MAATRFVTLGRVQSRRGRWSAGEVSRLKRLYGRRPVEAVSRELGRSPASIERMAASVFADQDQRTGPWSAEEGERLKESLGVISEETIAMVLGRTVQDVHRQIGRMGKDLVSGRWTRDEVATLKRYFGTRTDTDLQKILGRSARSIQKMAAELNLAKDKAFVKKVHGSGATRMPRWTDEEVALLSKMYPDQPNQGIAEELGRSVKSVVSKAHDLRLKKNKSRLQEMGRQNVARRYSADPYYTANGASTG